MPPQPGSTDFRLLRVTMRARWLRCRRSEDARYAVATGALPSHPPGDARDGAHRWIRAEPTFPAGPDDPVDLARTLLGTPYVWGGLSGRGIDCSGLVHLVHRALGTVVPRDARDQAAAFPAVALEDVRRGALYIFARPGRPVHHVGLVVEPGVMLHASDPDGGVVESPLASSGRTDDLWGAARVGGRLTMSR
jgi:cell wall-associated NlpC family hydrolase